MQSQFDKIVSEAWHTYLVEQDEQAVQPPADAAAQQMAPQGAPQAAPQDAAMAQQQPDENSIQAGFDVYKNLTVQLLRVLSTFAGAIESNDEEQLIAIKKMVPDDLVDQINQTAGQIPTSEPAAVAQAVNQLLSRINPTPTGA
jgi:hypothetical protein